MRAVDLHQQAPRLHLRSIVETCIVKGRIPTWRGQLTRVVRGRVVDTGKGKIRLTARSACQRNSRDPPGYQQGGSLLTGSSFPWSFTCGVFNVPWRGTARNTAQGDSRPSDLSVSPDDGVEVSLTSLREGELPAQSSVTGRLALAPPGSTARSHSTARSNGLASPST